MPIAIKTFKTTENESFCIAERISKKQEHHTNKQDQNDNTARQKKEPRNPVELKSPNPLWGGIKMSYTELIKETLNILNLNVTFEENCLRKEK